jgi:hypothetical protein
VREFTVKPPFKVRKFTVKPPFKVREFTVEFTDQSECALK